MKTSKAKPSTTAVAAPVAASEQRGSRKVRVGTVISNKMQKTIVVRVVRHAQHGTYQRVLRLSTSFKAHDENNEAKPGDLVQIMETRPLSKDKRWRLVEVLKRASTAPGLPDSEDTSKRQPRSKDAA
jgi:small subunit ribosomal protein S17